MFEFLFPKLDVIVSPEKWVFVTKDKRMEVETFVCLEGQRVVSVGLEAPRHKRVDLFKAGILNDDQDRRKCLIAFFQYCLMQMMGKVFVMPRMRFLNLKSLQDCTAGHAKDVLNQLVEDLGKPKVEFLESEK